MKVENYNWDETDKKIYLWVVSVLGLESPHTHLSPYISFHYNTMLNIALGSESIPL